MIYEIWSRTTGGGELLWEVESDLPLSNSAVKQKAQAEAAAAGRVDLEAPLRGGYVQKAGTRSAAVELVRLAKELTGASTERAFIDRSGGKMALHWSIFLSSLKTIDDLKVWERILLKDADKDVKGISDDFPDVSRSSSFVVLVEGTSRGLLLRTNRTFGVPLDVKPLLVGYLRSHGWKEL